ncbi:MAG: M1 family metallopeptidase [Candidatus Eremiobacteraeota bacterium]|nr:M1 family metallopeptidase [Candidatus Eremiobacteraeota bacterium]
MSMFVRAPLAGVLFLCSLAAPLAIAKDRTFLMAQSHLPKTIFPERYDIRLRPDLAARTLEGRETIRVRFTESSATLALYSLGTRITSLRLDDEAPSSATLFDSNRGLWRFHFHHRHGIGLHSLAIAYTAHLQSFLDSKGMFYVRSRHDETSFATEMEPADARRVFPSWDEPLYKARFHLSVVVPKSFTTVSNMPVESTQPISQFSKLVTFETTPPMSTYLVAICGGRYAKQSVMVGKTRVTIYTMPSKLWAARIALKSAAEVLPFYERYLGLAYPLTKLDLVAIPNFDTSMENLGAIVGGEHDLLLDPARPALHQEKRIFEVVSHEIAHQWSGDLVTHAAWNDLWLSEGFAEWLETKSEKALHPRWANDPSGVGQQVFVVSGDRGNEAIRETGSRRWSVSFSSTQYQKAASMIALFEHVMKPPAFQRVLQNYLRAYAYSNATTNDFLTIMNRTSSRSLAYISDPWLYQRGYPHLTISERCENGINRIAIKQKRDRWWPVLLANQTLVDRPTAMLTQSCHMPFAAAGLDSYFSVDYGNAFDVLARTFSKIPVVERDIIVQDTWTHAGDFPKVQILPLLAQLDSRDTPDTIGRAFGLVHQLEQAAQGSSKNREANAYVLAHFSALGNGLLRSASVDQSTKSARAQALLILSLAGDPQALAYARKLANSGEVFSKSFTRLMTYTGAISYAIGVHADTATHAAFLDNARLQTDGVKAAFWYNAYFSDSSKERVPNELSTLASMPSLMQDEKSDVLLHLGMIDPGDAWAYARKNVSGQYGLGFSAKDIIVTFATVATDQDLRETLLRWFTPNEIGNVPRLAATSRAAQAHQREQIDSFFASHI